MSLVTEARTKRELILIAWRELWQPWEPARQSFWVWMAKQESAVLTIGPCVSSHVRGGTRLDCVLFATDFSRESSAAASYAFSIARENGPCLVLLGVIQGCGARVFQGQFCVADAMRQLHEALPKDPELSPTELVVDFGDPADRIVEAARQRAADLIVLGSGGEAQNSATQLVGTITQQVIARATCPVLTVSD